MEQQTPPKSVMDVTPPTGPVTPVLPPTNSDSAKLPLASASQSQVGSRNIAGGTGGGAPGMRNVSEHDGEASASDRTRTKAAGPTNPGSLAVHAAPAMTDDEQSTENASPAAKPHEVEVAPKPHTSAPKTHGPALAITGVVLGMLVLSALAILIYLNS